MDCDVAVIGGGPAGATVGALLRKYAPNLDVAIFESDRFPRDHVGESQLPVTPRILHEMGVWDKVEAANFPVKIGARYRWGALNDDELWPNYFVPDGKFEASPRPGKYEGQRVQTAFQVDRAIYDKILLDHCREMGCHVFEETEVVRVEHAGDSVLNLEIQSSGSRRGGEKPGEMVNARYYVDTSGARGLLREVLGIPVDSPTSLRNIAIWDYWQNAEWAETIGIGGTMVQVMSIGWGWLWFIPVSPTRSSLGLVTSADFYKKSGKSTERLYLDAIGEEKRIRALVTSAHRENQLRATKDWSFVAERMCGENWFLAGDACGFADPILAAGLSLAHMGARRVAFSIVEMAQGDVDPAWIRSEFERIHSKHIRNHIRFADYWYSANAKFTDLKDYCAEIAKDSGLSLDPDQAFQWLGAGGFSEEISGLPFAGTYRVGAIKAIAQKFSGKESTWEFKKNNVFDLDIAGAEEGDVAVYEDGRVLRARCLFRNGKTLPIYGYYKLVFEALQKEREARFLSERVGYEAQKARIPLTPELAQITREVLEVMISEGWVKAINDSAVASIDGSRYAV